LYWKKEKKKKPGWMKMTHGIFSKKKLIWYDQLKDLKHYTDSGLTAQNDTIFLWYRKDVPET
jgi:hypothetical protein